MAKWWKFGLGKKGEGKKEAPAPAPTPTPAPEAEAPAPEPAKKKGLFGRIKNKVSRKPKEAPPEAPPAAPPAPPGPPAPPAPPVGGPAEGGGEEGEGEEEAPPPKVYPSSVSVSVDGTWVISNSVWHGPIGGTLSGADAKAFLIHLEKNHEASAIALVARAYDSQDMGFARYLSTSESTWGPINYS